MEEQKKNKKPPFYSLVRARHTGGTPFRATQPLTKPVLSFHPATRSRTAYQKEFEFKATLNVPRNHSDFKQKILFPTKSVPKNTLQSKENQPIKTNLKIKKKESATKNGIRKKPVVLPKEAETRLTRNKENRLEKNKVVLKSINTHPNKCQNVEVIKLKEANKLTKENVKPKKNEKSLCSIENKIEDASEILAVRLNERVFIMSPLINSNTSKRTTRRRPRPSAGSDSVDIMKSKNEIKDMKIYPEGDIIHHEVNHNGPEILRKKLNEEAERLSKTADSWFVRQEENNIPEHIRDEILAVVGQTRLLISDKFQQFRSLIDNAKSNETATVIKLKYEDLLGFWEMMYLQVEQLDKKYKNLDDLKNNKWLPIEVVQVWNNKKKKIIPKKSVRHACSKFRDFLKKKKEVENLDEKQQDIHSQGTPLKKTPSVVRTLETEHRTRRSSASSITLKKSFLAKAVLSPYSNS